VTPTGRGILAMSASVVVFIFNDALIKLAAETMPPLQAIGLRGVFATMWCGFALLLRGEWGQIHRIRHPMVALRGVLEAVAAISYLVALAYIPFAIATAVNLSTPLFLAALLTSLFPAFFPPRTAHRPHQARDGERCEEEKMRHPLVFDSILLRVLRPVHSLAASPVARIPATTFYPCRPSSSRAPLTAYAHRRSAEALREPTRLSLGFP